MSELIIRDDDTSYFTSPQHLEAIYGRLWEAGHTISLGVIPAQYGDIRVYWREGNPFDPSVPPDYRGQNHNFSILENTSLCDFLQDKARAGLVEICLHGYNHTFYEFTTHDISVIRQKLDDGMAILHQAFPDVPINTFIAPYDRISPVALKEILERGMTICTQSTNLHPMPDIPQLRDTQVTQLNPTQWLYTCDEYIFTHRDEVEKSLALAEENIRKAPLTIIANHYWMFFYDWRDKFNEDMIKAWHSWLDSVLTHKNLTIMPFYRA